MKILSRALFAFSLLIGSAAAHAELIDRVMAIVEQSPVLASDVDNRLRLLALQSDARGRDFPPVSQTLRQRVLDRLIEERALRAEAIRQGFSVSDEQVNAALNNLARGIGIQGGVPELAARAKAYELPFDRLRADTEAELLINAARRRAIENAITVSNQEAKALIAREGLNLGQVRLRQLFIALPQAPTPEQLKTAEQQIVRLAEQLNQGKDFEQLARENSQGAEAINGGDLGWREISSLSDAYRRALSDTNDQATTRPFRTRAGLHIVRIEGQRSSDTSLIEEVRTRHILMRPNAIRDVSETRQALAKVQQDLNKGANFAELAEAFSEDPVSASRGGELGWAQPSSYVPEFTQALAQLEPGQTSPLVQTQFGWHLIELLDRREVESENVDQLDQARNIIQQRQADEVAAAWSRRILASTYIERL